MEFTKEFLDNPIFRYEALRFAPHPELDLFPNRPEGYVLIRNGAQVQPNGDYLFQFYAPSASEVLVRPDLGDLQPNGSVPMMGHTFKADRQPNGVWTYVMPWDEYKTGHRHLDVIIDGVKVLWPHLPIAWLGSEPRNYVEVPDHDLYFSYVQDVPHGAVCQEIYWSDATKRYERCLVYTPPGYMKGTEEYPVLYLQHGGDENETVWVTAHRANNILDNLIAAGECVPFIIVMNNGMMRYADTPTDRDWRDLCLEQNLVESCIPYIESHYRVKTDKFSRALMGESMGCQQTCDIAFRHPELFGNFGACSSAFDHSTTRALYERPWKRTLADREKFLRDWKCFYLSYTPTEDHVELCLNDRRLLKEAGLYDAPCIHDHGPYPARFTRNNAWRAGLRDFAKVLFRD